MRCSSTRWRSAAKGGRTRQLAIDLEPGAAEHHVQADSARLQQVFWNLLKNAVKFTPDGGRIRVITSNPEPGRIEVAVIDPGIGIAPEDLPRLFNAFEQGNPEITRTFGGLGLGLAISKALVDQHGGTLTGLSPGRGLGATFTLGLATLVAPAAAEPAGIAAKPADAPALRLLLVEDNEPTLEVMTALLELAGHDVQPAPDVRTARRLAESHTFDLVVSDLGLPDGNGFDLMRELRDRYGLQGIAVSGFGMEEDLRRSRESGFREHLVKPVDIEKLKGGHRPGGGGAGGIIPGVHPGRSRDEDEEDGIADHVLPRHRRQRHQRFHRRRRGSPHLRAGPPETPHPATPEAMLAVIKEIVGEMPHFDRVAAGFPGVVVKGRTLTAPNLDPDWEGFDLAKALEKLTGKPARVANDAGVQGLAAIEGPAPSWC